MIHELLSQLGFDEKEIMIYLSILEKGKTTATEVARVTKINRTTVYSVVKELLKRRIITEDLGTPVRELIAKPPEELMQLVNIKQEELEKNKLLIEQAIPELHKIVKSNVLPFPKITFVPEEEIENHLYRRSSEWNKSILALDGIWWGFQDHTFVEAYPEWIDWFWKKSASEDLYLQLLSNQSEAEKKMKNKPYPRRKIRFWSKGVEFTASVWINGDYVIMINTQQHPYYLVEMRDAMLAHNLREMCKGIWSELEK